MVNNVGGKVFTLENFLNYVFTYLAEAYVSDILHHGESCKINEDNKEKATCSNNYSFNRYILQYN